MKFFVTFLKKFYKNYQKSINFSSPLVRNRHHLGYFQSFHLEVQIHRFEGRNYRQSLRNFHNHLVARNHLVFQIRLVRQNYRKNTVQSHHFELVVLVVLLLIFLLPVFLTPLGEPFPQRLFVLLLPFSSLFGMTSLLFGNSFRFFLLFNFHFLSVKFTAETSAEFVRKI